MPRFKESIYTELLKEIAGDESQCIQVHCKQLDELLGITSVAGIQRGILTELNGFPGSGKTQLCAIMDMKNAIFIDTRRGFHIERFEEIVTERLKSSNEAKTVTDFLSKIFIIDVTEIEDFISLIRDQLQDILNESTKISLIAIDSFSFLLKAIESDTGDKLRRIRIINELVTKLQILAIKHNIAIVLTNDFTTQLHHTDTPCFVPSLGPTFSHRIGQRLVLSKAVTNNKFYANLVKSKYNPCRTVEFQITARGIE